MRACRFGKGEYYEARCRTTQWPRSIPVPVLQESKFLYIFQIFRMFPKYNY